MRNKKAMGEIGAFFLVATAIIMVIGSLSVVNDMSPTGLAAFTDNDTFSVPDENITVNETFFETSVDDNQTVNETQQVSQTNETSEDNFTLMLHPDCEYGGYCYDYIDYGMCGSYMDEYCEATCCGGGGCDCGSYPCDGSMPECESECGCPELCSEPGCEGYPCGEGDPYCQWACCGDAPPCDDNDGDGYGDEYGYWGTVNGCVYDGPDCDDGVFDCNIDCSYPYYLDSDSDTYGNGTVDHRACDAPVGYVDDPTDCDDSIASCNVDCDTISYADNDEDTYGDGASPHRDCDADPSNVLDDTDCDDEDANTYPGAEEVFDGKDNDCDGEIDEGLVDTAGDFGDASDSTNHYTQNMMAYPKDGSSGTVGRFPTVFDNQTGMPQGPCHNKSFLWTYFGNNVSFEVDADLTPDDDNNIPNLNVTGYVPDNDWYDDGLNYSSVNMTNCTATNFTFNITVTSLISPPYNDYFVNVWFDWNRDGDWEDNLTCLTPDDAPEWAVRNFSVDIGGGPKNITVTTPNFLPYDPREDNETWMRMTIAPDYAGVTEWMNPDGSMNGTECFEDGETEDYYINLTIHTVVPPNSTNFSTTYGTTNFSEEPDITNVTNLTLATPDGSIQFPADYSVNADGEDYDQEINIGEGYISVIVENLDPTFNSTVNLTINNVNCPATVYYTTGTWTTVEQIIGGGQVCNSTTDPVCTIYSCTAGTLLFSTSHFTGFASAATANLTIWDETDTGMPFGDQTRNENEQVKFFANYTNSTGPIQGADCSINFTDSSAWMSPNSSGFYDYNRSFSLNGNYDWNVTCNKTGYDTLTANDTVDITTTAGTCYCDSCSNCRTTINNPSCTLIKLNKTIEAGNGQNCITGLTGFENKTLDCQWNEITCSGSGDGGIVLSSNNATITRCNISRFSYGIYWPGYSESDPAVDNLITNNYIRAGSFGLYLTNFENNTIINNTLIGDYPIWSTSNTNNNNITGNTITGAQNDGIYLRDSTGNYIYNNYFNNTDNINIIGSNYFNVSYACSPSITNIIGGNCTGGNFWASPQNGEDGYYGEDDGSGSYPHNISGDGIGDTKTSHDGDFLPLTNRTETVYECGDLITTDANFSEDLYCDSSHAIVIGQNGITIDCKGHNRTGNGGNYAIYNDGYDNVVIKNCNFDDFGYGGYYKNNANGNDLINLTITNTNRGVYFDSSSSNTITTSNITESEYGIYLASSSNNDIYSNYVIDSSITGVHVDSSSSGSLFYNNYFNSTLNINDTSASGNDWNTTEQAGTNILGGSDIGGNFFGNIHGYGGKDNNADGIGDTQIPFNKFISNGGDYLPLIDRTEEVYVCLDNITQDYNLTYDLGDCITDGFFIGADNVELDCKGHDLTGDSSGTGYGIYNVNGFDNTIIRNCNIEGFDYGIAMEGTAGDFSTGHQIINNTVTNNVDEAVRLYMTSDALVNNNTLSETIDTVGSGGNGVVIIGDSINKTTGNNITNNAISDNTGNDGSVYLLYTENNIIAHNIIDDNEDYGIYGLDSDGNTIYNNTANNNEYGIFVNGDGNNITENTANNNQFDGIRMETVTAGDYSDGNTIFNNTVTGNGDAALDEAAGVYIRGSNNIIKYNNASNNKDYSFFIDFLVGDCTNDLSNNYGSTNKPFLYVRNTDSYTLQDTNIYAGIMLCNLTDSTIDNVTVENSASSLTSDGVFVILSDNLTFVNSKIHDNYVGFYILNTTNSNISSNLMNNTPYGFRLEDSDSNILFNNTVEYMNSQSNQYGFYLDSSSEYNTLIDNKAFNLGSSNSYEGFYVGGSYNTLWLNTAEDITDYGFNIVGTHNNLTSNTADNVGDYADVASFIISGDNNSLTSNEVFGIGGIDIEHCFFLAGSNYNNLTSNIGHDCQGGINLDSARFNNLTSNEVYDSTWGISLFTNCYNNTIASNIVDNTSSYSFYSNGGYRNTFILNNATNANNGSAHCFYMPNVYETYMFNNSAETCDNGFYFARISSNDKNIIRGNFVRNCTNGFHIRYGDYINFTNNEARDNIYGFYIRDNSDNNIFSSNIIENNTYHGMQLLTGCNNNLIYDNYFNNTYDVSTRNAKDLGSNDWNTTLDCYETSIIGGCVGGNFWIDYYNQRNLTDRTGDGIGDFETPWDSTSPLIDGSVQDYLPLAVIRCGDVLTNDTNITLDANELQNCASHGLIMQADGIELDCGSTLINSSTGSNYGIYVNDSDNSEIFGCIVHDFNKGVYIESSSNLYMEQNMMVDNNLGMEVDAASTGGDFNYNYFNNTNNAIDYGTNDWSDNANQIGNFWSNYIQTNYDNDDDINVSVYAGNVISGISPPQSDNIDHYPRPLSHWGAVLKCGMLANKYNKNLFLEQNLFCTDEDGIDIKIADSSLSVTIDCQGHRMMSNGSNTAISFTPRARTHEVPETRYLQNSVITNCTIEDFEYGIKFIGSADAYASAFVTCTYKEARHTAINNNITHNTIRNTTYGIYFSSDEGFDKYTALTPNCKNDCRTADIYGHVIEENTIEDSTYGIYFTNKADTRNCERGESKGYVENNIVRNNVIKNNDYGIYVTSTNPGASESTNGWPRNNEIYNNIISSDVSNVEADAQTYSNYWNTTYNCTGESNILGAACLGGNYWSDYSGVDDGNATLAGVPNVTDDGIGDTKLPYNGTTSISSGGDYLPLTDGIPSNPTVTISSTSGNNYTTDDLTCSASSTDVDGGNLTYAGEWYKDGAIFVEEIWNATYDEDNDLFYGTAVDNSGNVYIIGTTNVSGDYNYIVIKYNSTGDYQWNFTHDIGNYYDSGRAVVVDNSGNVYATGDSNLTGTTDIYTVKLDSNGNEIWNATYNGGASDNGNGITLDSNGNVYVTGRDNNDVVVIKYNSTGNETWNATFNYFGTYVDGGDGIVVDTSGNIYLVGTTGISFPTPVYYYLVLKYNSTGDYQWNVTRGGGLGNMGNGNDIALDSQENLYVTGRHDISGTQAIVTFKFDSSGNEIWNVTYSTSGNDVGTGIVFDSASNFYISGYSDAGGDNDFVVVKYNSIGGYQWNKTYDPGNNDYAWDIKVDSEYIYVTGYYNSQTNDMLLIKYKDGFVKADQPESQTIAAGVLESQFTDVDDNWSCEVQAYDGTRYSNFTSSINLTVLEVPGATPGIEFVNPTPADNENQTETNVEINVSISDASITDVVYNWNGTNHTIYDDSLILMYNFNDYTYLNDTSLSGNDAYVGNGAPTHQAGKYGKGYSFDGDDGLNLSSMVAFSSVDNYTLQAWVNTTDVGISSNDIKVPVLGHYCVICGPDFSLFGIDNSTIALKEGVGNHYYGTSNVSDGNWHHLIWVGHSNGTMDMYVDGIVESKGVSYSTTNGIENVIGRGALENATADIDELFIWNTSFTSQEVYQIYASNLQKFNDTQWYLTVNQSKNSTAGLDLGNYTYQAFAGNTWNSTEERTINIQELYELKFINNIYTFNANRTFNSKLIEIINELGTNHNVTANVTWKSVDVPANFFGAGTFDTPLAIYSNESFNLSFGTWLAEATVSSVTFNISLYNETDEVDTAQVVMNLPSASEYDFNVSTNQIDVTISNVANVDAICSDSTKNFTIINNGTQTINDLTINITGSLPVKLSPSLELYILEPGSNVTIEVIANVNQSSPTSFTMLDIIGAGISELINVSYTNPGGSWAAQPTQNDRYLIAYAMGFICINNPSYIVPLDFDYDVTSLTIDESEYVGTFDDRCHSYQPHDTYFRLNNNLFLSILDDVPYGTIVSDVNPAFVQQNNTLKVTSLDYQGGGHFCANAHNSLRLKVSGFAGSYCSLCNSTETSETNFTDGEDNDCDGQVDCFDLDSCGASECTGDTFNALMCPEPEIGNCSDGVDNDKNGLIDCNDIYACCGDSVCAEATSCRNIHGLCDLGDLYTTCYVRYDKYLQNYSGFDAGSYYDVQGENLVIEEGATIYTNKNVEFTFNDKFYIIDGAIESTSTLDAINISAPDVRISESGIINTDGGGYGCCCGNHGCGPGGGIGWSGTGDFGGGAGYGGKGGRSNYRSGGDPYGSSLHPTLVGSGGGAAKAPSVVAGEEGGGAIIISTAQLLLDGNLSADGINGGAGGAGSGGSIWITTDNLSGSGILTADGGNGLTSNRGGAGSGGRIAVHYNHSSFTGQATVKKGIAYRNATPGTLIFIDIDDNTAYIQEGFRFQGPTGVVNETTNTSFFNTDNPNIWNFTELTIVNAKVISDTTADIDIRADTLNITNVTWTDESTTDLTLNITDLKPITSSSIEQQNILIYNTSNVELISSVIYSSANITTTNLTLDSNSGIIADGKGYGCCDYRDGHGPGGGKGYGGTGDGGGGGGYGGKGGRSNYRSGGDPYGSSLYPTLIGSGGGRGYMGVIRDGEEGGGAIRLISNTLSLDGNLSADGITGGVGGGGSGGSIWITTENLFGSGILTADGGNGSTGNGGGGGAGGRIAVHYNESSFTGQSSVKKGRSGSFVAKPGTLIFINMDDNTAYIQEGFRFQGLTTQANETTNTSFFNTDNINVWNFENLTIVDASDIQSDITPLLINVTDTLNLTSVILPNVDLNFEYGSLAGGNTNISITGGKLELERRDVGKIAWIPTLDAVSQFIENTEIGQGYIRVNSTAVPALNVSANITLEGITVTQPTIYVDYNDDEIYELCPSDTCEIISSGATTIFNVTHFTGYAVFENTSLTTDNNGPKFTGESVTFNATYVNESSGQLIQGATCNITFNDSSAIMTELSNKYEYNRSFSTAGNYSYNVTCNKTGFPTLEASDNSTIEGSVAPVIEAPVVNSTYGTNLTTENLTCYANATDADGDNLTYEGYWHKNGVQNIAFNTSPTNYTEGILVNVSTLNNSQTLTGENWSCEVRAYDSRNYSSYNMSNNLTIKSTVKEGIVPMNSGNPFYTNTTNPYTIELNASDWEIVTWYVNATGDIGTEHEFYAYANITSNMSISNITETINITIQDAVKEAYMTEGIFEPLCCSGGGSSCDASPDSTADVNCETGSALLGTHMHKFNLTFTHITAPAGTAYCNITMSNGSTLQISKTHSEIDNANLTLNYTVQNMSSGAIDADIPWILTGCDLNDTLNSFSSLNQLIFVHNNSWSGLVGGGDMSKSLGCYLSQLGQYFNNSVKCHWEGDLVFASAKSKYNTVEMECHDGVDNDGDTAIDCNDPDCLGIAYFNCPDSTGYFTNHPELTTPYPYDNFGGLSFGLQSTFEDEFEASAATCSSATNICTGTISVSGKSVPYAYTYSIKPAGTLKIRFNMGSISSSSYETSNAINDVNTFANYGKYIYSSGANTLSTDILGVNNVSYQTKETIGTTKTIDQVMYLNYTSTETFELVVGYGGSATPESNLNLVVDVNAPTNWDENDSNLPHTTTQYIYGTSTSSHSCNDNVDNDLDFNGRFDCRDSDCYGEQIGVTSNGDAIRCEATETTCWDGFDNDGDGLVDCEDPHCNTRIGAYYSGTAPVKYYNATSDKAYCEYSSTAEGTANYSSTPSSCNDSFNNDADYGNQYNNFYCDGSYADCRGKSIDCFDAYSCWGRNNTVSSAGGICPLREDECGDGIDNDFDVDLMGGSSNWKTLSIPDPLVSTTGADCDDYDCYGLGSCPTNEGFTASWCFDGKDNDLDAYYWNGAAYTQNTTTGFDCDDPDCAGVQNPSNPSQICLSKEFVLNSFDYCWDALDNDFDTKTSCTDNQIDRDNATKVATNIGDLTNSDCWAMYDACDPCPSVENYTYDSCADSQNNDHDTSSNGNYGSGGTDCVDSDCAGEIATYSGTTCSAENTIEQCTDGKDNDGDGAIDCSDLNCDNIGICERNTENTCNDGIDNNYNNYADCAEPDCYGLSGCMNSTNGAEWTYASCTTIPHSASGTIGGDGTVTYNHLDRVYVDTNYTLTLSSSQSHTSLSIFVAENDASWGKRFPYNTSQCTLIDNEEGLQWLPESTGYAGKIQYIGTLASFTVTLTCTTSSTPQVARSYVVEVNAQPNSEIKSSTITTQLYENNAPTVSEVEVGGNLSSTVTIDYNENLDFKAKPSNDASGICGCYYTLNGSAQSITGSACTISSGSITQDYTAYLVNVSARDGADNTGTVYNNPTFAVDLKPIETTSTYKLSRAFYNSTAYTSVDIGSFTFTTGVGDTWPSNCDLIVENSSKQEVYRTTAAKAGASNTLTCSGSIAMPANVTTNDGMYFVRVNVTDSDGDSILSGRKVFYVCNNVNSAGTGWTCAKKDMDNDGITEGLYTTVYSSLFGGSARVCDSCPDEVNLGRDDNGNGYDDACEPEEEDHDPDDRDGCEDQCTDGEQECRGQNIFECRDTNGDGCDEWALKKVCPATDECQIVDGSPTCVCEENWICDDWEECSPVGRRERDCEDLHSCGTDENKPETERSCIVEPEVEEPTQIATNVAEGGDLASCVAVARNQKIPPIKAIDPTELMGKINLPAGYEIIKQPFRLECTGQYVELTISIPEDYGDIRALKCSGTECNPISYEKQEEFICGSNWAVERTEVRNTTSIKAEEIEPIEKKKGKITDKNRILESGKTRIEFYGELPPVLEAEIGNPEFDVHQPKNPSLSIVGTPTLITVKTSYIAKIPAKLTLPYLITEEYEEESIAVYVSTIEDGQLNWEYLDGQIDSENKTVTVDIEDITLYTNGNDEAMFAPLGIVCETCGISKFEKIYHESGSRDAVILVHGLDSSPATFNPLIDDFRFNNQPWQIWTLSYSSTRNIETTAIELANYMQMHSNEYDTISIVGHSLGAIISQQALHYSDIERVKDPESYSYLDKVRRAVLVAAPNKGSPGAEIYLNYYKYLSAFNESVSLFNVNSEVIKELVTGRVVPRVRGVKYYVLAGTKPMDFNIGLFKITTESLLEFFMKNDGIVTTESAQFVGGEYVNKTCVDYWEINTSHSEIIAHPLARKFVEKVLSESISQDAVGQGLIGYNQYFKLRVDECSPDDYYFIIGKKIRQVDVCDPCNCGDGICGACENQLTCSADCGIIFQRDILGPIIIYILLLTTFMLTIGFTTKKFVLQTFVSSRWIKAIATFAMLSTVAALLYSFNYQEYLTLAYVSIAFIVSYVIFMEVWAAKTGFNRWLGLKKTAIDIEKSEGIFRKFNEKASRALSFVYKPFRFARAKIDSIFKKNLESDIEGLKKELKKLEEIEKGKRK